MKFGKSSYLIFLLSFRATCYQVWFPHKPLSHGPATLLSIIQLGLQSLVTIACLGHLVMLMMLPWFGKMRENVELLFDYFSTASSLLMNIMFGWNCISYIPLRQFLKSPVKSLVSTVLVDKIRYFQTLITSKGTFLRFQW